MSYFDADFFVQLNFKLTKFCFKFFFEIQVPTKIAARQKNAAAAVSASFCHTLFSHQVFWCQDFSSDDKEGLGKLKR